MAHPVTHTSAKRALAFAAAASALGGAIAAPAGAAPRLVEHTIASQRVADADSAGLGGLVAGWGVVAWAQGPFGKGATRLVTRSHGATHRRSLALRFDLRRDVDTNSGRVVTRIVTTHRCTQAGCPTDLYSPTLRKTHAQFAPVSEFHAKPAIAADGRTRVTVTSVAEPVAADRRDYADLLPPSHCLISVAGRDVVVPPVADCTPVSLSVRGAVLLLQYDVPSGTASDHYFNGLRWAAFDLERPERGWIRIGDASTSKGGSNGVQAACVLDGSVAVLTGAVSYYPDIPSLAPPVWSLSKVSLTTGATTVSVPAAQLASGRQIACDGARLYGITRTTRKVHGKVRVTDHIARLTITRG